jgi:steroid 5-alpha reductase family enzyme
LTSDRRDRKAVVVAYLFAGAVALWVGTLSGGLAPLWVGFWADVAATVAIFACSVLYRNSSFYDPYWSVAPVPIAVYWWAAPGGDGHPLRQALVFALVLAWAVRLTWNWARSWGGLDHEDWRYVAIREKTGAAYWPVSFLGIHLMPTLFVFAGCLPLYAALRSGGDSLSLLDAIAALWMAGAIAIEARADRELLAYRREGAPPEAFLRTGLWARSRHPNYFGEISFWWGLFVFGLAADGGAWWAGIGAVSITLLFLGVSLPLMERRMRERRPAYAAWAERVPLVIPRRRVEERRIEED